MLFGSQKPLNLYIATRYGLLRAGPDGMATVVPGIKAGLTAMTAILEGSAKLLVSGYGQDGGKLGVMMSPDGGGNWTRISKGTPEGAGGVAAFYALDVSLNDPNVVYGVYNGLYVSRDAARSWKAAGSPSGEIMDLAASSLAAGTVYAATKKGLFISRDGGAKWDPAHSIRRPATMVQAAPGGTVYAFVLGSGFISTVEPSLAWKTLFNDFGDRHFLHLAVDPSDPNRLYATTDTGAIMISGDGGRTWSSFEGSHTTTPGGIAKGKQLYEENCQDCHGAGGIGESPEDPDAKDEYGFKAPALNDDAHAWHHSDKNLAQTILNGSSRNERMGAFKDILSGREVENIIAYIKSLWSFRSLACQGARHMACMSN
ncbi:MAG: c-type cytochrome [Rhodospirillales bacterium]